LTQLKQKIEDPADIYAEEVARNWKKDSKAIIRVRKEFNHYKNSADFRFIHLVVQQVFLYQC
jgi:hypothetical protein